MTMAVLEIEQQIEKLTPSEFFELNKWINEYENKIWDKKIENNAQNINLANLANSAVLEFQNVNTKQL